MLFSKKLLIENNIWKLWVLHPNNELLTDKLELGTELMENGQHKYAYTIFTNIIIAHNIIKYL